jgi:hypothetical protein
MDIDDGRSALKCSGAKVVRSGFAGGIEPCQNYQMK